MQHKSKISKHLKIPSENQKVQQRESIGNKYIKVIEKSPNLRNIWWSCAVATRPQHSSPKRGLNMVDILMNSKNGRMKNYYFA